MDPQNNCVLEIFFDQALERAAHLDDFYAKYGKTIGPLHGLPISLKDQFHVKGVDTTQGYVGWIGSNLGINDPSQAHSIESQVTAELLSLGAVLYCKTSLPQTLLFGETKNNITGTTLNPKNQTLSCGGSSGGEGALQALRGSTLGLGTDIGGSVRIPAAFNGIFSLKPTPERISYRDVANTSPGQNTYRSAVGFMSTSLDGLELALKSILSTKPWLRDPAVVPIPYRQEAFDEVLLRANANSPTNKTTTFLKFGILRSDGIVKPHPPISRGIEIVTNALKATGHKVWLPTEPILAHGNCCPANPPDQPQRTDQAIQLVDWNPPSHSTAQSIHVRFPTHNPNKVRHPLTPSSRVGLLPNV